jgi:PTS system fructose-specific IIA component
MLVADVLNRNAIVLDLPVADKAGVLDALADFLLKDGAVTSKAEFIADVYAREAEGKTGIGGGVAIPHGKSAAVVKTCVAVARLAAPIDWETLDGEPVRVVILFAVSVDDRGMSFVKLMSQVARKLAHGETGDALMRAATVDDIVAVFAS